MKIAISGKGGVGKTTLAALLALQYAAEGGRVIAVDADLDANLGLALGVPPQTLASAVPIAQMAELVLERTGARPGEMGVCRHLVFERSDTVLIDFEAGLEHLGRGTAGKVDALIVVVEPGRRSFQTAHEVLRMARELGVTRVFAVGNKVRPGTEDLITQGVAGIPLIRTLPQRAVPPGYGSLLSAREAA